MTAYRWDRKQIVTANGTRHCQKYVLADLLFIALCCRLCRYALFKDKRGEAQRGVYLA